MNTRILPNLKKASLLYILSLTKLIDQGYPKRAINGPFIGLF